MSAHELKQTGLLLQCERDKKKKEIFTKLKLIKELDSEIMNLQSSISSLIIDRKALKQRKDKALEILEMKKVKEYQD